jgi:FtsH-binding integral membrane protein
VALAAWLVYAHAQFGTWPTPDDPGNLSVPPLGWIESFRVAYGSQNAGSLVDQQIGSTAPPYLIALAVLLLAALWAARKVRSPLDTILILQVILMASLGWRTLAFPHEMYRIPSLAILAALAVLLLAGGSAVSRDSSSPDPASR